MHTFTHEPKLEDYYQHGTYNYQQYQYDLEIYHNGRAICDDFGPDGQPWYPDEDTLSGTVDIPQNPKISSELQKKLIKLRLTLKNVKMTKNGKLFVVLLKY